MVVLVLLVLLVEPADVRETLNSQWPDLLPRDCGRRQVMWHDLARPLVVGEGNTTAFYGQYPWQARIKVFSWAAGGYVHRCGGIVVTRQHVITAAHCVGAFGIHSLKVTAGDWRFGMHDDAEQELLVSNIYIHRNFGRRTSYENDIALLLLKESRGTTIDFGPFVQPACLPVANTEYVWNMECEVSGWGRTADGAPTSDILRGVALPLVSDQFCSAPEVHQGRFVRGRMFCAGLTCGGPDACGGDSGGPLVCRDPNTGRFTAFGIVSSGDPMGCGRKPGLYTKLSGFAKWLRRRLRLDLGESASRSSNVSVSAQPSSGATISAQPSSSADPTAQPTTAQPSSSADPTALPTTETHAIFEAVCGQLTPADGSKMLSMERPEDIPWLVTIHTPDGWCTGVVVSDRWILSGDECTMSRSPWKVRSVPKEPNGTYAEFDVIRSVAHPERHPVQKRPFLYLLKTSIPIPLSSGLLPICLPEQHQVLQATAAGQPLLLDGRIYNKAELSLSNVTVTDAARCARSLRHVIIYREPREKLLQIHDLFCAEVPLHDSHACQGRSRRVLPLMAELAERGVRRWYVVGMTFLNVFPCVVDKLFKVIGRRLPEEWILANMSHN